MNSPQISGTLRFGGTAEMRTPIYQVFPCGAPQPSQMAMFTDAMAAYTGKSFPNYHLLHDFTVQEYRTFWRYLLQWLQGQLEWSGNIEPVCVGDECEHAVFFPNVHLNYADNLLNLKVAPADAPAITACYADGRRSRLTRGELRNHVACLAQSLSRLGISTGDHVVGMMRNDAEAIIAALAATAIGATLSTASPEMGVESLFDRFGPLSPKLLFAHTVDHAPHTKAKLVDKIGELAAVLPSLNSIVCLDGTISMNDVPPRIYGLQQLIDEGNASEFIWDQFPFNHPLFILFSSGTTGKPKCIVHGAGGSLLEHVKEHRLHCNLLPGDRMYFHTSCAWMMWNWQLSALASGVEIVTYDGPISSVDKLWHLVADEGVTVFGTSPAYLKMCEDMGIDPGEQFDLRALRAVLSTGAILFDNQFFWVRDHVKNVPVQSISGGTDILGCFVLGHPDLPVYAGEAQCKSLGLGVQAWEGGTSVMGIGQLVCTNPFPSRPLGFFGDSDGLSFHNAYFAKNPSVWTHGDLIEFSPEGTARLYGRCDGILNVRGINVGPGEIYHVLSTIPAIRNAIVVEQRFQTDGQCGEGFDQRIVLLVTLQPGVELTNTLVAQIRFDLAQKASSAHVPNCIIAVDELPMTHSGKLSESAVRSVVNGLPVANESALCNPDCLATIASHPKLKQAAPISLPTDWSYQDLERYLQLQWERLLGFTPIESHESFFELGGNSLLGARALGELNMATGYAVSLATLLVAPTIAELATIIFERKQPCLSPLMVQIRAGAERPVFFVHSASGSVMELWEVIKQLETSRRIYGLQARGLDGDQPAQRHVKEMATSYIEQMRTVQHSGPYAIIGYSLGGLIALEIAQQLLSAGERIEMLSMLDTYVPEHHLPLGPRLQYQYRNISRHLRMFIALPFGQRSSYFRQKMLAATNHLRMRTGRMPYCSETSPDSVQEPMRSLRESMRVAMACYHPKAYHGGPIMYIRASKTLPDRGDPLPLWRRLARDGLTVVPVIADHHNLVTGDNAKIVAAVLQQELSTPAQPHLLCPTQTTVSSRREYRMH